MSEIKFDILDYMGRFKDGVLTLISLSYQDEFYEGTFFYTDSLLVLTVDKKLEEKLGCVIEDWYGYKPLMLELIKKVVPIGEIYNRLDEFVIEKYYPQTEFTYIESESGPDGYTQSQP